jgi:hypothetical protein
MECQSRAKPRGSGGGAGGLLPAVLVTQARHPGQCSDRLRRCCAKIRWYAERAGFTREGLLRAWLPTSAGRRDSVMYSLRPDDPPAQHL